MEILYAPSSNYKVEEILRIQNISSIHAVEWDSLVINSNTKYPYMISNEFYLDANRMRQIQYLPWNEPWIVTVVDLISWDVWQYDIINKTYIKLSFPDTLVAFELISKKYITSNIGKPTDSLRFDFFDDKKCHIISDSLDNIEWIWTKHGLPIRWNTLNDPDGITVEKYSEYRNIEINKNFSDSLFKRPE